MMSHHPFTRFCVILASIIVITRSQCVDKDNETCDFCLSQSDFEEGTYRIINSGLYCLTSNIEFNPTPGSNLNPNSPTAWFPTNSTEFPGSTTQTNGAFALGFFAVISIEASNVKIDLNGFAISYHYNFYLQQRFGSIIEIANSPFLPSTGPAEFGPNFENVNNITICNGNLGLSSHHGIHSNNASNVIITDLMIFDFEVAGIQLNGFQDVLISNVEIGPALQKVPLTGNVHVYDYKIA